MKRSKNYRAAAELVTPGKVYAPLEAVRVAKQTASRRGRPRGGRRPCRA